MAQHSGDAGEAMASARAVLAARDRDLADADAELTAVITGAYAGARDAISRLESIRTEVEAAAAHQDVQTPLQGREFARFLLDKQHEMIDIVAAAKADAAAKVAALQQLTARYQ